MCHRFGNSNLVALLTVRLRKAVINGNMWKSAMEACSPPPIKLALLSVLEKKLGCKITKVIQHGLSGLLDQLYPHFLNHTGDQARVRNSFQVVVILVDTGEGTGQIQRLHQQAAQ
mmetsp:Transcript_124872/g.286137  ORF Transcript_124872/g.286137 Transcript_124872/m.286137 type:complete len:115 (-) Transcript_124872:852-1196(-)